MAEFDYIGKCVFCGATMYAHEVHQCYPGTRREEPPTIVIRAIPAAMTLIPESELAQLRGENERLKTQLQAERDQYIAVAAQLADKTEENRELKSQQVSFVEHHEAETKGLRSEVESLRRVREAAEKYMACNVSTTLPDYIRLKGDLRTALAALLTEGK